MKKSLLLLALALTNCKTPPGGYGKDGYGAGDPPNKDTAFGVVFLGNAAESPKKLAESLRKFCVTEKCSIGLLLGNNFGKPDFESVFKDVPVKFFAVAGGKDNAEAQLAYKGDHFLMPNRSYSIDGGWLQFHGLFTKKIDDAMLAEVKKGEPRWRIAYGFDKAAKSLNPLLEAGKVDFYLYGESTGVDAKDKGVKHVGFEAGDKGGFGHLLLKPGEARVRFVAADGKVTEKFVVTR